ncbi:hypothetical protein A3C86_03180 [Candidatus Kaiserbacteria bacterium RIFCSPHIGHO2_02_FULL_49_16]|uniref:Uncharacterized protein n=1 Tax=Candidatus Kaiserbacteria bacterium RIFCSPHIGHO2_02_FULL_49_16 TaxID=1798490 RepID=A0A1F6DF54_9BACT|nr:MAG: hypothetical protein A3C86_03180 [Candidatus Kaiserbacteria bacterium RIFCSPHIGHO2_02_FULL_49_16]
MRILLAYLKKLANPVFFGIVSLLAQTVIARADDKSSTFLENPLRAEYSTIPTFIAGALKAVVIIALPIIVLFFVIAGFKFISAQGNPSALDEARKNFMWVVIGALLIMGAWVLATLIASTVSKLVAP